MVQKKKAKDTTYVCMICSKKQKSPKKVKCCGKDMVTQDKGTWNV